jgi:nucleoside diphosphate kinase
MKSELFSRLHDIESTGILERNAAEQLFAQGLVSQEYQKQLCIKLAELLTSEEMFALADKGEITFSMLRPGADRNIQQISDAEVESYVKNLVQNQLKVITSFSIIFTPELVEEFYGGAPKDVQIALPPELHDNFENRWEEFKDLMTSGPASVILLHDAAGQAVSKWRNLVGHWDVVNRRDPKTLRGQLAVDNYNNLLHGSDSAESVKRELRLIAKYLLEESQSK